MPEPGAVAMGSNNSAKLDDPVATALGSDTVATALGSDTVATAPGSDTIATMQLPRPLLFRKLPAAAHPRSSAL